MLPSLHGYLDRDRMYAAQYGEEKLFKELDAYSEILGRDWVDAYSEKLPDGTLEEFHQKALREMKLIVDKTTLKNISEIGTSK